MDVKATRRHWPMLAVLLLFFVGVVLRILVGDGWLRSAAEFTTYWLPILVALFLYAERRSERFQLFLNRARFQLLNPESTWSLTGDIEVNDADGAWDAVISAVEGHVSGMKHKVLAQESKRRAWIANGLSYVVATEDIPDPIADPGDYHEKTLVHIEIPEQQRSFRTWRRIIEREAAPLVSVVEQALIPYATEDRTFVARIGFGKENPYFGLFVARLGRPAVVKFQIEYLETFANEEEPVRVYEDRMEVVTRSLNSARALSLQYLALATPAQE